MQDKALEEQLFMMGSCKLVACERIASPFRLVRGSPIPLGFFGTTSLEVAPILCLALAYVTPCVDCDMDLANPCDGLLSMLSSYVCAFFIVSPHVLGFAFFFYRTPPSTRSRNLHSIFTRK